MKRNKEWLKEEVNAQNIILDKGYIYTEDILKLIDQLEEPEQEKVVIPQFVADWIETMKQQDFTLGQVAEHLYSGDIKWSLLREYERWARLNFTKFTRAWLDGYTVEKEKLYRVKVDQGPNYLYVESLHLYADVIKPLDFNHKFSPKEYALKFTSRNQAKGVAELVGGEVEEITK